MDKKILFIVAIFILGGFVFLGIQSGFFSSINPKQNEITAMPEGIVLFYGDGCSHCKDVEDFVVANKVENTVKFTRLETWYNKSNALLLISTAKSCKVDISQGAPVPLLWDGIRCYMGGPDVINFFKNVANIQ